MKSFIAPVLLAGILFAPSLASAQVPEPIEEALEAIESGTPYDAKVTGSFVMKLFGTSLKTDTKVTAHADEDGDSEGKMTISMKADSEKVSLSMEYKYFPEDGDFYFKFVKLPKDLPDSLEDIRSKVWYVASVDDSSSLSQSLGQSGIAGQNFIEAQEEYPAYRFVEKGSTKKEYRYAYTVNDALLEDLLMEQARLSGQTLTSTQAQFAASLVKGMSGTLSINKSTMLPTKQTQKAGSSGMSFKSTATYKYGDTSDVERPLNAISDSDVVDVFFPTL